MTLRIGSLCTGYGGLDMAVRAVMGGTVTWVADNDKGAAAILAHHYPHVPNHGDITRIDWSSVEPVDVITAGFPCQPVSTAGKRLGDKDDRWIWPQVAHTVRVVRPRYVFLENVAALTTRGLDGVVADLAALGYVGSWRCIRASDIGAPHRRERIFILAEDADRQPRQQRRQPAPGQAESRRTRADAGRRGRAPAADTESTGREALHTHAPGNRRPVPLAPSHRPDRAAPADAHRDALREQPIPVPRGGRATVAQLDRTAPADTDGRGPRSQPDREPNPGTGASLRDNPGRPGDRWGPYAPAIARWEHITGRPAPSATEPGRTGLRLSARFVEWLMGLPGGHVTDVPGLNRTQQLHALGNGVVPMQAASALAELLTRTPALAEVTP